MTNSELKAMLKEDPDELARQLYKMAGDYLRKNNIYPNEDLIQDLVLTGLNSIEKFDSTRGQFSTYLYLRFKHYIGMQARKNRAKKNNSGMKDISIYSPIGNGQTELIDTIEDPEADILKQMINDEKQKIIKDIMNKLNPITIEWLNGKNQADIAKEKGLSQSHVSRLIKHDICQARKEVEDKWRQTE